MTEVRCCLSAGSSGFLAALAGLIDRAAPLFSKRSSVRASEAAAEDAATLQVSGDSDKR